MKNSYNDSGPYSHLLFEFFVILINYFFHEGSEHDDHLIWLAY